MSDETAAHESTHNSGSASEVLRLMAALDQLAGALDELQAQMACYHGLLIRTSQGTLPTKVSRDIEALDARIAALIRRFA